MLIENPKRRGRRNLSYIAPSYYNPSRKRRRKRNTGGSIMRSNPLKALAIPREWSQGIDLTDAGAAVGGLAASTMLPGMLVRVADTTGQKLLKIGASLACALGAGYIAKNISPSAGKAAVTGGVAGTVVQALGMFTSIQIGEPKRLSRRIGEKVMVSPIMTRSDEEVSVIIP